MTKAVPAVEPSMEDILASIRKIIAEDPPGSRAVPEPAAPFAPEPYLRPASRSEPFRPHPSASVQQAALQTRSEPAFQSSARAEPVFTPEPVVAEMPAPAAPAVAAWSSPSVDDQLSDLLGPASSAVEPAPVRPVSAAPDFINCMTQSQTVAAAPAAMSQAFRDLMPEAKEQSALESRPGFTVSRAGYLPDHQPEDPKRDPFHFELGPSPFASRVEPASPVLPAGTGGHADTPLNSSHADLGSFVPVRNDEIEIAAPNAPVDVVWVVPEARTQVVPEAHTHNSVLEARTQVVPEARTHNSVPEAREPSVAEAQGRLMPEHAPVDANVHAHVAAAAAVSPAEIETRVSVLDAPGVEPAIVRAPEPAAELTLESLLPPVAMSPVHVAPAPVSSAPVSPTQMAAAETTLVDAVAPVAAHAETEHGAEVLAEFSEAIAGDGPVASAAMFETFAQATARETPTAPASTAITTLEAAAGIDVSGERTMEDTVAELLRPMLKSWLSENMPKIVERALRKEIAERNLIEHKPAAE